jgi:hypothetical protein
MANYRFHRVGPIDAALALGTVDQLLSHGCRQWQRAKTGRHIDVAGVAELVGVGRRDQQGRLQAVVLAARFTPGQVAQQREAAEAVGDGHPACGGLCGQLGVDTLGPSVQIGCGRCRASLESPERAPARHGMPSLQSVAIDTSVDLTSAMISFTFPLNWLRTLMAQMLMGVVLVLT